MLYYVLSRLGRAIVTVLMVVTFAFVVLRLSGDPATVIMGADAPPEAVDRFRRAGGWTSRSGSNTSPFSRRCSLAIWASPCGTGATPSSS